MALSNCSVATDHTKKELSQHGLTLFPIACYDDDLRSINVPWHWHDEFEFIIMTTGTANIHIENKTISLSQGNALFINSGILHSIEQSQTADCTCHSIVFHARLIGGSVDSIFWQELITPVLSNKSFWYMQFDSSALWQEDVVKYMETAWQAIAKENDDFENDARYYISKAFRLMSSNRKVTGIPVSKQELLCAERTKVMIQYIQKHYSEEISLENIADSAAISKSICLRCFRQHIGTTPVRYLLQYRIEKASEQLMETSEKINVIAMNCGFSDFSYFSKCFREIKGLSPLEYRKSAKKENCKGC